MQTVTPIAIADDLVSLRALVEALCIEVELQAEQLRALRRTVLSFDSTPDGRLVRSAAQLQRPARRRGQAVAFTREAGR
jgi:hypothetical protein